MNNPIRQEEIETYDDIHRELKAEREAVRCEDRLRRIRQLTQELNEWKRREYPIGCIVRVGDNYGLASAEDGCPPDKLPVRFENNNVWWKPLETISRVTDLKAIPPWVRRMKLRWAGYAV